MTDDNNVVHIGDFAVARKYSRWTRSSAECLHRQVELDDDGEIVACMKCGKQVSAYWYLQQIVREWEDVKRDRESKQRQLQEDMGRGLTLRIARKMEGLWRTKNTLPACPHCARGIAPQDTISGTSKDAEAFRRRREGRKPLLAPIACKGDTHG